MGWILYFLGYHREQMGWRYTMHWWGRQSTIGVYVERPELIYIYVRTSYLLSFPKVWQMNEHLTQNYQGKKYDDIRTILWKDKKNISTTKAGDSASNFTTKFNSEVSAAKATSCLPYKGILHLPTIDMAHCQQLVSGFAQLIVCFYQWSAHHEDQSSVSQQLLSPMIYK